MAHLIWVQLIKAYLTQGARMSTWIRTGHIWGLWVSFSQTVQSARTVTVLGHVLLWPHLISLRVIGWGMWRDTGLCWAFPYIFVWGLPPFFPQLFWCCVNFWVYSDKQSLWCDPVIWRWPFSHTDWTKPLRAYQVSVSWNLSSVSSHGPDVILASSCFNSWGALSHWEHQIKT